MGFRNPDHDTVEPVKKTPKPSTGYVVPMSSGQKKEWSDAVSKAKDISTGKVTPPYLKK